jgi:hypothetical protein
MKPNPAIGIVIASETKQSRLSKEIATHLSGARNDIQDKQFIIEVDLAKRQNVSRI